MKRFLIVFIIIVGITLSCQKRIQIAPEFLELPYPAESDKENLNKNIANVLQKVWLSYQKGYLEDCDYQIKKALNEYPKSPPLWVMRGYISLAYGDFKKAEKSFTVAIDLKDNYPTALNGLAFLALRTQNYPKAYELYAKIKDLYPNFPYAKVKYNLALLKAVEFYKSKAQNAAKHRRYQEAIDLYKKAIVISPNIWELHYELALIYIELKDFNNANVYLQIATNLNPDNVLLRETFADSLFSSKNFDQALKQYDYLLTIDPLNATWENKKQECKREIRFLQLPAEFQNIDSAEKITRALFSAYLMYKIPKLANIPPDNSVILVDVSNHWAKDFMIQIANLGILETNPNHTFLPDSYVKRTELAIAINKLLSAIGKINPNINLNNAASDIIIEDIPKSSLVYPIIAKIVGLGIMNLNSKNQFNGDYFVSGREFVQTINKIEILFSQSK